MQLDIKKYKNPTMIVVGYAQLQDVALVVSTLVKTINRALFAEMCKRWAVDWRKRADWDVRDSKKRLKQLWDIFHSKKDLSRRKDRTKIHFQACIKAIDLQYALDR